MRDTRRTAVCELYNYTGGPRGAQVKMVTSDDEAVTDITVCTILVSVSWFVIVAYTKARRPAKLVHAYTGDGR